MFKCEGFCLLMPVCLYYNIDWKLGSVLYMEAMLSFAVQAACVM